MATDRTAEKLDALCVCGAWVELQLADATMGWVRYGNHCDGCRRYLRLEIAAARPAKKTKEGA